MWLPISTKQSYQLVPELFELKESGTVAQLLSHCVASQVTRIRADEVGNHLFFYYVGC